MSEIKIVISINGVDHSLTLQEAKALHGQLQELFAIKHPYTGVRNGDLSPTNWGGKFPPFIPDKTYCAVRNEDDGA